MKSTSGEVSSLGINSNSVAISRILKGITSMIISVIIHIHIQHGEIYSRIKNEGCVCFINESISNLYVFKFGKTH